MENGGVKLRKQKSFPYYKEYKAKFPITEETIFVYKDTIYSNKTKEEWAEYYDVLHHEIEHLRSQQEIGADEWINRYLNDKDFRLNEELRAYRHQLKLVAETTKDKNELFNITDECANNLSSELYGSLVTKRKALELLKT